MATSILADLTVMLAAHPEDVATRAVELILRRSEAARVAVTRLFQGWHTDGAPAIARWTSQVGGEDEARTDLQGFDDSGRTVAILENKFWAGLTPNQPGAYLERLAATRGALAFIVPTTRVPLIRHEVGLRIAQTAGEPVNFHRHGQSEVSKLPDGRAVIVAPWSALLGAIAAAQEAAQEYDNLADLRQIEGLVRKMEGEGFRPLTATDITGPVPHLIRQLCALVDDAIEQLLTRSYANKKGLKAGGGSGWYGHYVSIYGHGCQMLMTARLWQQHGMSPIWLRVSDPRWKFPEYLRTPLRDALDDHERLEEDHSTQNVGFWIPIRLLEDCERDAVLNDMLRQLDRIAEAIASEAVNSQTGVADIAAPAENGGQSVEES